WDAASRLSRSLGDAGSALVGMFSSATEGASGQGFLDWIDRVTTKWKNWVDSPDGQGKMAQFWSDVEEFSSTAYQTWQDLRDTWNSLDTETARDNFNTMVEFTGTILSTIEKMAPGLEAVGGVLASMFAEDGPIVKGIERVESAWQNWLDLEDILKPGPNEAQIRDQKARDAANRPANAGVNIGVNSRLFGLTPLQEEQISEWYTRAGEVGRTIATSLNTGMLVGFGATNPVELGYILGKEGKSSEGLILDANAAGARMADALKRGLQTGVVQIPEDVGPRLSDAQRRMLESAGLSDEEIAGAFQHLPQQIGNQFVGGMSAGLSAASVQMGVLALSTGTNIANAFGGAFSQVTPIASQNLAGLPPAVAMRMFMAESEAALGAAGIVSEGSDVGGMVPLAASEISALDAALRAQMNKAVSVADTKSGEIVSEGSRIGGMVPSAASAISGLAGAIGGKMASAYSVAAEWARKIKAIFASVQSANTGA